MSNKKLDRAFGLKIQTLRRQRGLSQEQLAEKIGRSTDTISNIERGSSSTRIESAAAIAKVLGVTLSELFDFAPDSADKNRARRRLIEDFVRLLQPHDETAIRAMIRMAETVLTIQDKKNGKKT
jgi:transcriptional regulator with XRE-family HTH domain